MGQEPSSGPCSRQERGQWWEEPGAGGGRCVWQEQAQPGRQQAAGGQAGGCQVQRVGTQGNEFMPRKQGPTKASLLGQCSSP